METSNTLRSGLLSVVLPAYNEEESVPLAAPRMRMRAVLLSIRSSSMWR